MSKIVAIVAGLAAVAAIGIGAVLWHPWDAGGGGDVGAAVENGAPEGASPVGEEGDEEFSLRLSSWDLFDEYWEAADASSASYSEEQPDGTVAYYALKEGREPSDDLEGCVLLYGAERADASSDEWDAAVVDCSTGETSRWRLSDEVLARLSRDDLDLDIAREQGIVPYEGRWAAYVNWPQVRVGAGSVISEFDYWTKDEAREYFVTYFKSFDDQMLSVVVRITQIDEDLMTMLVNEYGQEYVNECIERAHAFEEANSDE